MTLKKAIVYEQPLAIIKKYFCRVVWVQIREKKGYMLGRGGRHHSEKWGYLWTWQFGMQKREREREKRGRNLASYFDSGDKAWRMQTLGVTGPDINQLIRWKGGEGETRHWGRDDIWRRAFDLRVFFFVTWFWQEARRPCLNWEVLLAHREKTSN